MENYEVLFLVDSGIGNALEAFYALEYCMFANVKTGIFLNHISKSFQEYARDCYGDKVILSSVNNVKCKHLIHSFTFQEKITVPFETYHYVAADYFSTNVLCETEQYLSIVKALFPCDFQSYTLTKLKETLTDKVIAAEAEQKTVMYPGSRPENPYKRWGKYRELEHSLGLERCLYLGGLGELDFQYSYRYRKIVAKIFPQAILNKNSFWRFCKSLKLLLPYSHFKGIENQYNSYFNYFNWYELVALLKRCKNFVGNDGGISHLAGAAGAKGAVIFGPTSVNKNKTYNPDLKPVYKKTFCSPCQFQVGGIGFEKYMINCPFGVKCLNNITVKEILEVIES